MIQAEHISKSYGNLAVLKEIDLKIAKGEVVSITGKSGAGKTTLLHILGTLDNPDSGRLSISGQNVGMLSKNQLAAFRNKHIGFVFQFHHLLPEFSALENVCIPAFINGSRKAETEKRALYILEYLGLAARCEHKPGQLSGGEQQRVAVARALINNPDIVFADEPSGNLDSESSTDLHKLIFQLRNDFDQTFVIVTHNMELADMSDRVLKMEDGRIL